MKRILLAAALAAAAPTGAMAGAYAFATLNVSNIVLNIAPAPTRTGSRSLFADSAATFAGTGPSFAATASSPGTADATQSTAGAGTFPGANVFTASLGGNGARGDSLLTTSQSQSVAEGRVVTAAGSAILANANSGGRFTHTFNLRRDTVITITFDANRSFVLDTDFRQDVAKATSSVTATLSRVGDESAVFDGVITGAFDINASDSVADGDDFARSNSGSFTVTFAPIERAGQYTLNIATRTTIDALASGETSIVPAPGALALFGFGLAAASVLRRRRG